MLTTTTQKQVMKGGRRERRSPAGGLGQHVCRQLSLPACGVQRAAFGWCLADGGGCQESVKSLINVSSEHR